VIGLCSDSVAASSGHHPDVNFRRQTRVELDGIGIDILL
jgi:hypothetical protein